MNKPIFIHITPVMMKRFYLLLLLSVWAVSLRAQQAFTLQQVIEFARGESPVALQAANTRLNRYWQYRTFQSNYKPQLAMRGNLPNFNRSIQPITLPNGELAFVPQSFNTNSITLSLTQAIGPTGGSISVNSALQRIDIIGDDRNISYLATPAFISFQQPLLMFNDLKWDKKIEPLRYQESVKRYNEDMEALSVRSTQLFFDVLLAQINRELAQKNLANNDTIYRIAQGRYEMGRIAENELLQLELGVMNAQQQFTQAQLDFENNILSLKILLGNNLRLDNFTLIAPVEIPEFEIDETTALVQAKNNRERFVALQRRRIEAEREVARARGDNGADIMITGSIGFTQRAASIADAYNNLQSQQLASINLFVPIIDWGRQQARIKTAQANAEVIQSTVAQDELTFEQEVMQKVRQFRILREQLKVAIRSDEVALRSYDIAQNRYLISKITINELINILAAKDDAKRRYLSALRSFWTAYYELRQLTLYDFELRQPIVWD
jgi:outer membrane protein TolC